MKNNPGLEEFETPTVFARRIGVNKSTITRAIQSGRLHLIDGKLHVVQALADWENSLAGSRPDVEERHAEKRAMARTQDAAEDEKTDESIPCYSQEEKNAHSATAKPGTRTFYQAQKIDAENRLILLERAQRDHRRYSREAILAEAESFGGLLRGLLERMIDESAALLSILPDPGARREKLVSEIEKIRRTLRKQQPVIVRRLRKINLGRRSV